LSFDFPQITRRRRLYQRDNGAIAERDVFFCGFVLFDHETARLFRRRYLFWSFSSRFASVFAKAKLFFPEEEEEDIT
jgi:hypothetical protein